MNTLEREVILEKINSAIQGKHDDLKNLVVQEVIELKMLQAFKEACEKWSKNNGTLL